jgi:hypothetical protein
LLLPPAAQVQRADLAQAVGDGPAGGGADTGIDSLDYTDCCGGGGNVPADSELAVGKDHIIAVVNVAFEIYRKSDGARVAGPTTFASFFSGTPNCSGVFDPNVIYDESADQFILGIDADGKDYCIAAAEPSTADPAEWTWNRYSFPTDVGRNFFDYPHAGVGDDAIYIGANMFGRRFFSEGRVWAVDKTALYSGSSVVAVVTQSTGGESTPQPMNLHGWAQGTWPEGGPHYILTDGPYDGARYGVWAWTDPFGADILDNQGTVNLNVATEVTAGAPVDAPQLGGNPLLDGNDFRVQDAEYRNGDLWMANTISCNPGGGAVNCVRWAQIDPESMTVLDSGVYASPGEYRIFADLAANHCDDMAVGYTKTSGGMYPAVYVSGRESDDPDGQLQSEVLVKAGEIKYTSFQSGSTHRWGDYTAMTVDPDGLTFWYMGQYAKDTGTTSGRWGNYIDSFRFAGCSVDPGTQPGAATQPGPGDGASGVAIDADLSWTAGKDAITHKVYFGTSSSPGLVATLNAGTEAYDPGTLAYDTPYYWRVDEVNGNNTETGALWSFTTMVDPSLPAPGQAGSPDPQHQASGVAIDAVLSWSAGLYATSHRVYFGVCGAALQDLGSQSGTSYAPGPLEFETEYCWRIDEVNTTAITPGVEWSFTTTAQPTLVPSSENNGKTWTARVTDSSGANLTGSWSLPGGACSGNVCTLSGIAKKEASVTFTAASNEVVTVLKP